MVESLNGFMVRLAFNTIPPACHSEFRFSGTKNPTKSSNGFKGIFIPSPY